MTNPLLEIHQLPPFSKIKPEHIEPALKHIIDENNALLEMVASHDKQDWEGFVEPLEDMGDRISQMWSPISHLNSVMDSDELREAYNKALPVLTEYFTRLSQDERLFNAFKKIEGSSEFSGFTQEQKKYIEHELRDFRLSGVDLPADKKQRYQELQQSLSQLTTKFSENVLDATHAWTKLVTDETDLKGLPEHALVMAKQLAQEKNQEGYLLTLDIPSYLPVMQHAENQALRQEMYDAYVTRASDQGPNAGEFDNAPLILDILKARLDLAQLLGFNNFSEYSLAPKMANTTTEVLTFLNDLAEKAKPQAERDFQQLKDFVKSKCGVDELNPWDVAYYSEKLRQKEYAFSEEDLRPYFPVDTVLKGLFDVVSKLYGLHVHEVKGMDAWHPDVRFFEVRDKQDELNGYFYIDLYARAHKRGGAWMDECRNRRRVGDALQIPVAYLTCNFTKPIGDKPALFAHDEVITLFHEFGHTLHHILTRVDVAGVAGINGVAWDAVELPSQFLENWCWEKEVLKELTEHVDTGESLPDELYDKMMKAKNFQSAMQLVRQIEFALFDFELHLNFEKNFNSSDVQALLDQVRDKVSVVPRVSYNRFQNSFSHIFAGGYAAGYYSYLWAEVLSADAYSKFEEDGVLNAETGASFLTNILERGGSEEMSVLFERFRGRPPKIDALLKHRGIIRSS